jgi:hypothetical protein
MQGGLPPSLRYQLAMTQAKGGLTFGCAAGTLQDAAGAAAASIP